MKKLKTISALLAVMILLSAFSACSGNDTKNVEPSKESSLDNTSIESSQSSKAKESLISKQESSLVESSNEETDEISEEIINLVIDKINTGTYGDGKIFVYDVADAVRIRTGERGVDAL